MPSNAAIVEILWRYKKREDLTEAELDELKLWLRESPRHKELFDDLSNTAKWDREIEKWQTKDPNATWNKIQKRVEDLSPGTFKNKTNIPWIRYISMAAAIGLIVLGIFWWQLRKKNGQGTQISQISKPHEILPGSGTATLKLGDGSVIQLNSIQSGRVATQGNTNIVKTDSAALNYQAANSNPGNQDFNVLSTPKGGQYSLVLPDGSKVWLNAASTLRFPVSFSGGVRRVELSGEAYFEVAQNKQKPFIVQTERSLSVRVLGTHFNVDAYADEPLIKTALLEGSVSVSNSKDSARIKPGQEAQLNDHGEFTITPANEEQVTAWRNKILWFQKAGFEDVMRELSRWYDVQVLYQGKMNQTYTGILPTSLPLTNVLKILEKGGNVHFTLEDGNKITVRP